MKQLDDPQETAPSRRPLCVAGPPESALQDDCVLEMAQNICSVMLAPSGTQMLAHSARLITFRVSAFWSFVG
ncbi:hypothetical protein TYRP_015699 [Tyrophagus putrescentiae]|nr:hypothetical protein TYRP_015699 [Tyrophagus putrescentiae]